MGPDLGSEGGGWALGLGLREARPGSPGLRFRGLQYKVGSTLSPVSGISPAGIQALCTVAVIYLSPSSLPAWSLPPPLGEPPGEHPDPFLALALPFSTLRCFLWVSVHKWPSSLSALSLPLSVVPFLATRGDPTNLV